jgi:hypothetical protein
VDLTNPGAFTEELGEHYLLHYFRGTAGIANDDRLALRETPRVTYRLFDGVLSGGASVGNIVLVQLMRLEIHMEPLESAIWPSTPDGIIRLSISSLFRGKLHTGLLWNS